MSGARSGFHHGDLSDALVQTGLAMSRVGGAEAIVLREATRRVGVTARAAYRHFADRDALVRAVARAALVEMARVIESRQTGTTTGSAMLRAVGEGYIQFALDEPGWFDVAFFAMADMVGAADVPAAETDRHAGRSPYRQLQHALTRLVGEGLLDAGRAADAALTCWSGVHGFATLTSRGPLRALPRARINEQAQRLVADLVDAVVSQRGVGSPRRRQSAGSSSASGRVGASVGYRPAANP